MPRFDGSVARQLDFGAHMRGGDRLRLALSGGVVRGPEKYKVLERRRRQAQITARRVLDLMDVMERAGRREAAGMEEGK